MYGYQKLIAWCESESRPMTRVRILPLQLHADRPTLSPSQLPLFNHMSQLPASTKHAILLEYSPRSPTHSFSALAARHHIRGGESTIRKWHVRWDGTPDSLEHKRGAGRPHMLTPSEVSRYVRAPILAANRAHKAVHYSDLLSKVRQKTGKEIALRTLEHYGQQELHANKKMTKKRTAAESECTQTGDGGGRTLVVSHVVTHVPLLCVTDCDSVSFPL
jgi:hypothetical protein